MSEVSQLPSDGQADLPAPLLRIGSRGSDVFRVQRQLKAAGFDPGPVDRIYGPQMAAAIRQLQKKYKLDADGILGPRTRRLLDELVPPAQLDASKPAPAARKGAPRAKPTSAGAAGTRKAAPPASTAPRTTTRDETLRRTQRALDAAGFSPGEADGLYGPNTAAAIRTFQLVHGLAITGRADAGTVEALVTRRLRLSGSVAAVARAAPAALGPSEFLASIRTRHPEYGGNDTTTAHPDPSEVRLSPYEWLSHIRALFDTGGAPELHGRLVVLGLILLDAGLAASLGGGLFDNVVREITEPLATLLTPRAERLLGAMGTPAGVRAEDRWRRLSPSCLTVLAYADGLRGAARRREIHVEHLAAGLYQDDVGPLRRLTDRAGVGREAFTAALAEAAGGELPSTATSTRLPAHPALSRHAGIAMEHAFRLAEAVGSDTVSRRHLLHGVLSVDNCGLVKALARLGVHAADVDGWREPTIGPGTVAARPMLLADPAADTVPAPGNGRVRRADRLGTAAEVEVLASVLLARDTPLPLAIGLFGDWGSGKSFFMAHMQERIAELADLAKSGRPEAEPFCREVRQVSFNAWHYVDSNLWASLAATLFDQLARAEARDEVEARFEAVEEARSRATDAQQRRERLEQQAQESAAKADGWRMGVRTSAAVAIRAVRNERDLRAKLRTAGAPAAGDEPTERLIAALGTLDGVMSTTRAAWRLFEEEVLHRRRRATLVALAVLLAAAAAASIVTDWPALAKAAAFVSAVAAALTPALNGALRVLYLAREAREARQLTVLGAQEALEDARLAEDEAKRAVAERERELADMRDRGLLLRRYVRQRATSPDYRDQLGVISKVRRDFEQLVALLPGGDRPAGAEHVVAVATEVTEHVPQVERIILYIDDLDRCPHAKVVDVLQAVHLLLAFKLFVVVVGVDSRWLERSLREHYGSLLEEPENYLEKIFQISFSLRRMSVSRYRALIDQLTPAAPPPAGEAGAVPQGRPTEPTGNGAVEAQDATDATPDGSRRAPREGAGGATARTPVETPPLPKPEALIISADEREMLHALDKVVTTPRGAKRLVNIYRMLRVSVQDDEFEAFRPGGGREYQAAIVLLAVLMSRVSVTEAFFLAVMAASDEDDIWQVVAGFPELDEKLRPLRTQLTVRRMAPYRRWAPRVSRFSLRLMAVLPPEEQTAGLSV